MATSAFTYQQSVLTHPSNKTVGSKIGYNFENLLTRDKWKSGIEIEDCNIKQGSQHTDSQAHESVALEFIVQCQIIRPRVQEETCANMCISHHP